MSQRVELLPPEAYFRFIEKIAEGNQAFTHAALLRVGKQTHRYYVKSYRGLVKPLFNEISGFLLAAEAGVPQAKEAALIVLPGALLDGIHPNQGFATQPHWICWGTTAIANADGSQLPTANTFFRHDLAAIANDLRAWKDLPSLLAFDEWVANVDRNTGNLVRLSAGDYAVIDHGGILTGPDWVSEVLAPIASYGNKIWSLLRCFQGFPLPISSGAVYASHRFPDAYLAGSQEMLSIGAELLSTGDLKSCHIFLRDRSLSVKQHLKQRLGMLV